MLGYYLGGALVGWLAIGGVCYGRWGTRGWQTAGVNGLICVIPTLLSFMLSIGTLGRSRVEQLAAVLGGFALRVFVALGLGLTIFLSVPYFRAAGEEAAYWGSLLFLYVFTLGWETLLVGWYRTTVARNEIDP